MGVKLGEAFVEVYGRLDRLEADLGRAETKSKGWAGRLGGFMTNALSFTVGGLIQQGVNGITNAMSGLAKGMIGGNAEFEQYQMRFEVLLKSADAAKARLAELADFGAKTPFDLPEVVRADTVLQGFGLHSEEAAKRFGYSGAQIRTIAGDVASGSGASFEQIAGYLGKFSAGATGEAIMRFQELGIVTRKQLADMGVQFDKAGALTSPVDKAMNTLLKIMSQKYDGMMAKQSKTFTGMLSNMRDWAGKALRLMGQPIFEKLRGGMESLLSFLDSPAVEGAINTFANWIANGIDGAIKSVDSLVKALTNSPIAKTITGMVSDIKEEGLGGAIKKWIGNAIDTVKDPAKRAEFVASLSAVISDIAQAAGKLYQDNIKPAVDALGETLLGWLQSGLDYVSDNSRKLSFDLGGALAEAITMRPEDNPMTVFQGQIATWLRDTVTSGIRAAFSGNNLSILATQLSLAWNSFILGFLDTLNKKSGIGIFDFMLDDLRSLVGDEQKQLDRLKTQDAERNKRPVPEELRNRAAVGPQAERPKAQPVIGPQEKPKPKIEPGFGDILDQAKKVQDAWRIATDAAVKYRRDGDVAPNTPAIVMQADKAKQLEDRWLAAAGAVRAYVAELNRIPAPAAQPRSPAGRNVPNSGAQPNRAPVSIVVNAAGFAPAAVTRAALTAVDLLRARGAI